MGLRPIVAALALLACWSVACATYEEELGRSQRAFDQSEHERALAILRALEPEVGRLSTPDRAHYAYLRGMTDYRIGYKADARHWLGMATAIEEGTPGSLPPESAKRMNEALKEMNETVYTGGIDALANGPSSGSTEGSQAKGKSKDDDGGAGEGDNAAPKKTPTKRDNE